MSKTFDLILNNGLGYICETYGEEKDVFSLEYILEKEMVELGNIDIPLYLEENELLKLDIYKIPNDYFAKLVNKEYNHWLNANRLEQGIDNLELFKEDCYFKNIQNNSIEIIDDIKELVIDYLKEDISNIKGFWLTSKDVAQIKINEAKEYSLPNTNNFICLSDMDEEGILIAFK